MICEFRQVTLAGSRAKGQGRVYISCTARHKICNIFLLEGHELMAKVYKVVVFDVFDPKMTMR